MKSDLLTIGRLVRKRRNELSLSQAKLAEMAGVPRVYIGRIERGQSASSIIVMAKVAKALQAPLDFFVAHIRTGEDALEEELHRKIEQAKREGYPLQIGAMAPKKLDYTAKKQLLELLTKIKKSKKR